MTTIETKVRDEEVIEAFLKDLEATGPKVVEVAKEVPCVLAHTQHSWISCGDKKCRPWSHLFTEDGEYVR